MKRAKTRLRGKANADVQRIIRRIRVRAKEIYPKAILDKYQLLERTKDGDRQKQIAGELRELKKKCKPAAEWNKLLSRLIETAKTGKVHGLRDVVLLEYAPKECEGKVVELAKIIAGKRAKAQKGSIRLCRSVYGFTTCKKNCNFSRSCAFAKRENGKSIMEKVLGNITTGREFYEKLKEGGVSNNRKIITTYHNPDKRRFGAVISALKLARKDEELKDMPICVSIGTLSEKQVRDLKEAGATRVNHNLEASYYNALYLNALDGKNAFEGRGEYEERLSTIIAALEGGLDVCSGGMFFYGNDEIPEDRALLYATFAEIDSLYRTNASPFNIYVPLEYMDERFEGWSQAFGVHNILRDGGVDAYSAIKALLAFALAVPPEHKIILGAGSVWFGKYYELAIRLGGGAGLKSYLNQMDTDYTVELVGGRNEKNV